jgi:hypothetical protein
VTTEQHPHEDAVAWLDGLTGRRGDGAAHAEASRLRAAWDAQARESQPDAPPWAHIRARAGFGNALQQVAPHPAAPQASNDSVLVKPRRSRGYWLAAAALAAGSLWLMRPESPPLSLEPQWRGEASAARWLSSQPEVDAPALAESLRQRGAQVRLVAVKGGQRLDISAPPAAHAPVNARLAALELALDAQGQLRLDVVSEPDAKN